MWRAVVGTVLTLLSAVAAVAAPRPDVVFIIADDLGWGDVGFHLSLIHI